MKEDLSVNFMCMLPIVWADSTICIDRSVATSCICLGQLDKKKE